MSRNIDSLINIDLSYNHRQDLNVFNTLDLVHLKNHSYHPLQYDTEFIHKLMNDDEIKQYLITNGYIDEFNEPDRNFALLCDIIETKERVFKIEKLHIKDYFDEEHYNNRCNGLMKDIFKKRN